MVASGPTFLVGLGELDSPDRRGLGKVARSSRVFGESLDRPGGFGDSLN